MTPTEPRGGEGPHAELFQRLDEILVEESPMHPFGCATWMEATQVAIDMAKEALSRPPVVHGWPEREAVAVVAEMVEAMQHHLDGSPGNFEIARHALVEHRDAIRAILSLFPPVVGWQGIDTAPKRGEYLVYQPLKKHHRSQANDLAPRVVLVSQAGLRLSTHWMPLPAAPLTDGVGE